MPYLLNALYLLLLTCLLPWLLLAAIRNGKYREGYAAKLLGRVPRRSGSAPCIWLHAVSVGEVNLLGALIAQWSERHPEWELVLSTTTMTGYGVARARYPQLSVFYCPLDFSWAVRRAIARVRPTLLVLAELELWPNLIRAAKESGARVAVVNARLGEKSFRGYRRIRPLLRRVLDQIDLIAAQDEPFASRFLALGALPSTVHVTGSMKYDGAQTDRQNQATNWLRELAGFAPSDRVFLAGSTQDPEESYALAAYLAVMEEHPELRLVIVPRHPQRFDAVARWLGASGLPFARRSALGAHRPAPEARILLVDAMGELGAWWGTADIAYVGGSLTGRGGQNMIEPAAYGAAVSFGPNTWNFRDVVAALARAEAAVVVRNEGELAAFLRRCLAQPAYASQLGRRAQSLVVSQQGATLRTAQLLEKLLPGTTQSATAPPRAA